MYAPDGWPDLHLVASTVVASGGGGYSPVASEDNGGSGGGGGSGGQPFRGSHPVAFRHRWFKTNRTGFTACCRIIRYLRTKWHRCWWRRWCWWCWNGFKTSRYLETLESVNSWTCHSRFCRSFVPKHAHTPWTQYCRSNRSTCWRWWRRWIRR